MIDSGAPAALLDRLIDPAVALPAEHPNRPAAEHLHAEQQWRPLADLYQQQATAAWRERQPGLALRLLLAESRTALRADDRKRCQEAVAFVAQWHRLSGGFTAAERWNHALLREPLQAATAGLHAYAWRELAALREVASRYDTGLSCCDRGIEVCRQYAEEPRVARQYVRVLIQKATLHRHRGELAVARDVLHGAREFADERDVDPFTRGLISHREGGVEIVLGRPEAALEAYRRAAAAFDGVSEGNLFYARLREVAALRALDRLGEALRITDDLATRFRARRDTYRLGQVLLERAEVLQSRGDTTAVAATLREAQPYYEGAETLEALRWHRHVARNLIGSNGDPATIVGHLATVLDLATRPERQDLNRTMLALYDLHRAPPTDALPRGLRHAAGRAALLAADLQRGELSDPDDRWSTHAAREEVYAAALLAHTELDEPEAAVRVAETGRADLLNQLLAGSSANLAAGSGGSADPTGSTSSADPAGSGGLAGAVARSRIAAPRADPALAEEVFGVARLAAASIRSGRPTDRVPLPPLPGHLPAPDILDAMADVVVVITLGPRSAGWWSSVLTRPRYGEWRATLCTASDHLAALLDSLTTGVPPERGMSRASWEELGAFLLPDPAVWAGSPDHPRSVMIISDPRLWHLPHAALTRDGAYLCDVAEVSLAPSLRTTELLLARSPVAGGPGTAVASGPAVSLLDSGLPGYRVEMPALADWPGGHRELPALPAVDEGVRPALLYLSGHGDQPGATALLGPGGVTMDALAQRRLPRLVVLNGCWSGTASSRYGHDPLSLAVGALIGGADTVVAGTGQIGGVASAHVAARLIQRVGRGASVVPALRAAQREIRAENPDLGPFDWAGLCVVGTRR
ncbi:CHAT domain-containing protein [Micromonospora sp. NPDC049101]|uniref:CHAT domain-containing protein n=1 Tax=Micromonospora sp. NPDC049101 TaxID=3155032 RepID=UPI0033FDA076